MKTIDITTNTPSQYITETNIGNVTIITRLFAVDCEKKEDIPMLGCEISVYVDGKPDREASRKGYIMPFRGYCFSIQNSAGDGSSQLYTTGTIDPSIFAEIVGKDTYGDVFIIPQIIECVTALGGYLPMRRVRGVSATLLQKFKARVIYWVMNKGHGVMSPDQQRFVDEQLAPPKKKSVQDFTPEELMAAVLKGEVTLKFN